MTIQIKNGSVDTSISRRGFVAGAAGLTFAFTLGGIGRGGEALGATQPTKFNAWVSIAADNTITIICPSRGNGAGRLHVVAADPGGRARRRLVEGEDRVRAGQSEGLRQPASICSTARRSLRRASSVPGYFMPLRMAGAQARKVLLDAVAEKWKVPVGELTTDKSTVIHKKSGRKISLRRGRRVRDGAGRAAEDQRKPISRSRRSSS